MSADLSGANVLMAGYGVTGHAVVDALRPRGARVTIIADDDGAADRPMPIDAAEAEGALAGADLVIASPGLAPSSPLLSGAAAAGVPVWSEVELAWRLRVPSDSGNGPAKWLAVTGTNGKTTTVGMLESMLAASGARARAVGNVGPPLITAALDGALDVLAIELSSFQLHYTYTMAADAAAILNIAPDHLDWHGGFDAYAADKARIYHNVVTAGVYNYSDPLTEQLLIDAEVTEGARAIGFTLGMPGRGMLGVVEDLLVDRAFHLPFDAPNRHESAVELATFADFAAFSLVSPSSSSSSSSSTNLLTPHTVANALAAAALARAYGVAPEAVAAGLREFRPAAHRAQLVRELNSVRYVDDSKATNAHAAAASLRAAEPGTVVWILGGLAKGASMDDLVRGAEKQLRGAVVIGKDQAPFTEALARHAPNVPVIVIDPGETDVMGAAVLAAAGMSQPGDTVLLAPAGASQDQFQSYGHRGDAFTEAARSLVAVPMRGLLPHDDGASMSSAAE